MTDDQFQILLSRIDELSNEQRDLVDFLGRTFGRIDQRFEQVDQHFEQVDRRFGALEGRVGRVEMTCEGLRHDLQVVAEGVTMNGERLDRHEARLAAVELSVSRIPPLEAAVSRLADHVAVLTSRVDAHG